MGYYFFPKDSNFFDTREAEDPLVILFYLQHLMSCTLHILLHVIQTCFKDHLFPPR